MVPLVGCLKGPPLHILVGQLLGEGHLVVAILLHCASTANPSDRLLDRSLEEVNRLSMYLHHTATSPALPSGPPQIRPLPHVPVPYSGCWTMFLSSTLMLLP